MGDLSEKISISTASLGLVLVITYTRKVMCFMLSFQVFAFIMQHPERWAGWTRVKREREQNDSIHLLVNKVVVNLGYESPSRDLWWSPGLRQGGCGSLPRVTLREPRGRSWSFLVQLPWQALNRQTGRKNCPAFKCGKSPVSQSVSEGGSWRTQGAGGSFSSQFSSGSPAAKAREFLCSLHCCQYLHAFLPLHHEIKTYYQCLILWKSGELEQQEQSFPATGL